MAVAVETLEELRRAALADVDPDLVELIGRELERQRGTIELIASENFTWPSVFEAVGSVPTNKYAEGYPGRRYYGGCEVVDEIEQLAIDRAKALFEAEHANVSRMPARKRTWPSTSARSSRATRSSPCGWTTAVTSRTGSR